MAECERMPRTVAHGWNVDYSAQEVNRAPVLPFGAWNADSGIDCVGHVVGS
ncbi:hypothetical protein GCM10010440_77980 [Kitasatospora cinereorecta]